MMTPLTSLVANTPTSRRLLAQLLCATAFTAAATTAAPVTLFQDTFETAGGPGTTSTQWTGTPTDRFVWSSTNNGPSVTGTHCVSRTNLNGYAKMSTSTAAWSSVSTNQVQSYTAKCDFQIVQSGGQAMFVISSDASVNNGYLFSTTSWKATGDRTWTDLKKVTAWNGDNSGPTASSLTNGEWAEDKAQFIGTWQTMSVTMTPYASYTQLDFALTSTTHITPFTFSYSDSSGTRLTSLSQIGIAMYRENSGQLPLVDNISVTANLIPEPAALTVLGAGLLFGLRRRRG